MDITELFWKASINEIKKGYTEQDDCYICLICGEKVYKGIIYPENGVLYEAQKYIGVHIEQKHNSMFDFLINMDKRIIGLSDHQRSIVQLFYQGKSDKEVQMELNIGSTSTIRNHRFTLKEKERQAKVFLTIMELLKERDDYAPRFKDIHNTAKMVDDRYDVTQEESEKMLKKYFPEGIDGPLKTFTMKEKYKLVVLREIASKFENGRTYTEKEVNGILEAIFHDFATLRRYLIEYGFLDRKPDGSQYWLIANIAEDRVNKMDRKKELKQQYKETKTEAGVYQIRNVRNGKLLVVSTPNLKTINGRKMSLEAGSHMNKKLQEDFRDYGREAFVFEVLEVLELKEEENKNLKDELKKLEEKWLEKLQPYGDKGYN